MVSVDTNLTILWMYQVRWDDIGSTKHEVLVVSRLDTDFCDKFRNFGVVYVVRICVSFVLNSTADEGARITMIFQPGCVNGPGRTNKI